VGQYRGQSAQDDRVFANAYRVKDIIMSFNHDEGHGAFDRTEPLPLASPTMVLRTRREVREELERSKGRRSLLRRTMLPSFLCQAMGVLIMFHPNLLCAALYYWACAVVIPWLVVRNERKQNQAEGRRLYGRRG
jgi:uncharacterized membrane protein YdbT with pleckstrin-like domain